MLGRWQPCPPNLWVTVKLPTDSASPFNEIFLLVRTRVSVRVTFTKTGYSVGATRAPGTVLLLLLLAGKSDEEGKCGMEWERGRR